MKQKNSQTLFELQGNKEQKKKKNGYYNFCVLLTALSRTQQHSTHITDQDGSKRRPNSNSGGQKNNKLLYYICNIDFWPIFVASFSCSGFFFISDHIAAAFIHAPRNRYMKSKQTKEHKSNAPDALSSVGQIEWQTESKHSFKCWQ